MTEPKKSDHWNALLNDIGLPVPPLEPAETPPASAQKPAPPPPAAPRQRSKPEPKPAPPTVKKSSWNSLLGALGLAPAEEPPAPTSPMADEISPAAPTAAARERETRASNPLDELKPRYKPNEAPFPPPRRREIVDDVAMDIDLDAGFEVEEETPSTLQGEEIEADVQTPPREGEEGEEPGGRRRRRRRRRGRRREERPERGERGPAPDRPAPRDEVELEYRAEADVEFGPEREVPPGELPFEEEGEPLGRAIEEPSTEPREGGRRRRRRRRGGREREGGEARERVRPTRRPERDVEEELPRVDLEETIEDLEPLGEDVEEDFEHEGQPLEGHAVHKKIPTWAETVGILIDANIAARSSRQADRGRPRRGRRDR